jgi:hypothetical protein
VRGGGGGGAGGALFSENRFEGRVMFMKLMVIMKRSKNLGQKMVNPL